MEDGVEMGGVNRASLLLKRRETNLGAAGTSAPPHIYGSRIRGESCRIIYRSQCKG
jgi:hypothetical protein